MTDFETYKLFNVDPDDISEVLVKIEKSFGLKFGDTELKDVKIFGEICDIIASKIEADDSNNCTTQQAFYKIRDAISEALSIDKASITTDTDLPNLLPKHIRRKVVKGVDKKLGFKTNLLRPKYSATGTLAIILFASIIGLFIFWKVGLISLTLSIVGLTVATKFANELDIKTVGQFSQKIARENYLKARRATGTANKTEIIKKVKEIFMAELGLEEHQLERQSSFV
jgi:acyl carrier protein